MAFLDEVKGNLLSDTQREDLKRRFLEALKAEIPRAAKRKVEKIQKMILEKAQKGEFKITPQGKVFSGGVKSNIEFEDPAVLEMAKQLKQNGVFEQHGAFEESIFCGYSSYVSVSMCGYETRRPITVTREEKGFFGRKKIKTYQSTEKCISLSELSAMYAKSLTQQAQQEGIEITLNARNCTYGFKYPVVLEVKKEGAKYASESIEIWYRAIV